MTVQIYWPKIELNWVMWGLSRDVSWFGDDLPVPLDPALSDHRDILNSSLDLVVVSSYKHNTNIIISILVCWSPQQVVDGGLGDGSKNPPITNLQNHCQEIFKEKTCKKYIFVGEYNFLFWRKKLRQLHRMGGTLPQQHWQTEKWTSCGFFSNFHFFMVQYCSVVEQFSVCILW